MASDVPVSRHGQDPNNPQPHVFSQSTIYIYRPLPEGTPTCRMCDIPMYANRTDTICTECSRLVEKMRLHQRLAVLEEPPRKEAA